MKQLKYTITFTVNVLGDENYDKWTDVEAEETGIDLPIDTPEKKAKLEKYFLDNDLLDLEDVIPDNPQVTIEVVDTDEEAEERFRREREAHFPVNKRPSQARLLPNPADYFKSRGA